MILRRVYWNVYLVVIAIALGMACGYQIFGESRDFANYLDFFDRMSANTGSVEFSYRFEPGFTLLVYLLTRISSDGNVIYTVIAGLCIYLKLSAISLKNGVIAIGVVFSFFYLSRYLILFEMTVLRATCAFSIAFFVFFKKNSYEYRLIDLGLLTLACTFHLSAVILFFVYAIKELSRLKVLIAALALYSFVSIFHIVFLEIAPDYIEVFANYQKANFSQATAVSIPYLIDLLYMILMFLNWEKSDVAMKRCVLGVAVGAALHFSLLEYSQLAGRFRELLSLFFLIYVVRASVCDQKIVREQAFVYVFISGILNLYTMTIHDPLLS